MDICTCCQLLCALLGSRNPPTCATSQPNPTRPQRNRTQLNSFAAVIGRWWVPKWLAQKHLVPGMCIVYMKMIFNNKLKLVLIEYWPDIGQIPVVATTIRTWYIYTLAYPGYITLQRTSVSFVGYSYPYPELLEVLYDIYTRTRNFWKFCTPVRTIPGVRVQHFYTRSELL